MRILVGIATASLASLIASNAAQSLRRAFRPLAYAFAFVKPFAEEVPEAPCSGFTCFVGTAFKAPELFPPDPIPKPLTFTAFAPAVLASWPVAFSFGGGARPPRSLRLVPFGSNPAAQGLFGERAAPSSFADGVLAWPQAL